MDYNYRLDTSNIEKLDEEFVKRQREIKRAWLAIMMFFLEKGTIAQFKYWPDDVTSGIDIGYSGYGIKQMIESTQDYKIETHSDGLLLLSVMINKQLKKMITESMNEDHVHITPFFHIDILDKNDKLIYSTQDYGCNVLMTLHEAEMLKIANQLTNKSFFISLPETININMNLPNYDRN